MLMLVSIQSNLESIGETRGLTNHTNDHEERGYVSIRIETNAGMPARTDL